jgi:hypothetical protein
MRLLDVYAIVPHHCRAACVSGVVEILSLPPVLGNVSEAIHHRLDFERAQSDSVFKLV